MRTVADHLNMCLDHVAPLAPLDVTLPNAVGCVLAETVEAPSDRPVADSAMMDGYAVHAAETRGASEESPLTLEVIEELRAGDIHHITLQAGSAVRIASGAPLPEGADAVLPLENTNHDMHMVKIHCGVEAGDNVMRRGEDVARGDVVVCEGDRVGARQVALLAGVGRLEVRVRPHPRVVVVSIGDELIEPGEEPQPGRVFDANGHSLATAMTDAGADTFRVSAVPDEPGALLQTLEDQLLRADVIVTTGGLSYGAGDTVKEVLAPLGTVRFDNVAMTPGKQLGIGTIEGVPIFCLPGDPVAAQIAYEIFVRPCLRQMAGWEDLYRPAIEARMESGWTSPLGRREFVRVRVSGTPGPGYVASLQGPPQRQLLSAFASSNALAVIPEDVTEVRPDDSFYCMILD